MEAFIVGYFAMAFYGFRRFVMHKELGGLVAFLVAIYCSLRLMP